MASKKINRLKDPAKFLFDNGLLFAINHQILHPLGLAMEIIKDDNGNIVFGGVWDYREDPEAMLFEDETLIHGTEKLNKFMDDFGNQKLQERMDTLGFIHQPIQSPKKPAKIIPIKKIRQKKIKK